MVFSLGTGLDILTSIAVLLLATFGLYIIYGLMRVINMAHGELLMLGAYVASMIQGSVHSFWIATLLATLSVASLGMLLEWCIIRRLYEKGNLSTLLATWGISLCLMEGVRLLFGPSGKFVDPPTSHVLILPGGIRYPAYSLFLVCIACAIGALIWLLFHWTKAGIVIRATMEDPVRAESCGINTRQVYRWTFTAGCGLAGLAGALLAPISSVTPFMGLDYAPRAFLVVILGGTGSLLAPLSGTCIVAGVRSLLNSFFGVTPATLGMLGIALLILFVRPSGIVNRD